MNPLRMGVIGCGAVAQIMHIPYMAETDRFKLVAVADPAPGVVDVIGDRYTIPHRFADWRDVIARDDIDAVAISHSGSHRDSIIAALDAGKHVLVEKPLTWNLREAREVQARADQSDRILQIAYHKLYDPAFAYAKQQVEQMRDLAWARITCLHPANELGLSHHLIHRANGTVAHGHVEVGTIEEQRQLQLKAFAGGAMAPLVDEALGDRRHDERLRLAYGITTISIIHHIYMMHGLLGDPVRVVSTDIWRDGFSIHSVIEYPNDVRVTLDWHFLSTLKDYREEYAFFGNHDRVFLQFPSPYLKNAPSPVIVQGGDGELTWEKRVTVSHDEAFRREVMAFYDNVQHNRQPHTSIADVIRHITFVQQIIDAAR